ncbi:MAG: hypothetical protein JSW58_08495 [Candidatus Latescibacterota bacterium]|nr:MAG: hypothetical protein JSW58_08495 [Candidatus Latescibacterota bacterium]
MSRILGPDEKPVHEPTEPKINIGFMPEKGLLTLQVGGGERVGVPWLQGLAIAYKIIGMITGYLVKVQNGMEQS